MDDTTLIGVASIREVTCLRKVLEIYLASSNQQINEDKSNIFFFNTPKLIEQRIANIPHFRIGKLPVDYLGIPLYFGKFKREWWKKILEIF